VAGANVTAEEDEKQPKQVNQSLLTVLIAFLANLLIAIAKSVAAAITSSASMLAEAAHSWADAGNEIFLLIADRRS
jgi:divalent metal cation (Fe/Co/Zn/Cd) transporter